MIFNTTLQEHGLNISRKGIEILQVNIGRKCNLACHHCHVEASPTRTENMDQYTADHLVKLLENSPGVHTVDFTGGAPELNPHFRKLVEASRSLNKNVIVRCNLTVLFEPGQEDTAIFFQQNNVNVVASLPCYSKENVERQRGNGVFNKSIEALRILNDLGYGDEHSGLQLDLVYNPGGAFLPPEQEKLEKDYKRELKQLFNISFNSLFAITNLPVKRFHNYLEKEKKLDEYYQLLLDNFNPHAAESVMCRNLISIGWDGAIYDCDFNQMLEMSTVSSIKNIFELKSFDDFNEEKIVFANHCYGCTAGAGSSCGGTLA